MKYKKKHLPKCFFKFFKFFKFLLFVQVLLLRFVTTTTTTTTLTTTFPIIPLQFVGINALLSVESYPSLLLTGPRGSNVIYTLIINTVTLNQGFSTIFHSQHTSLIIKHFVATPSYNLRVNTQQLK